VELLEGIEGAAASPSGIRFVRGGESRRWSYADLWRRAGEAAASFSARCEPGECVAMLLAPSIECVSALIGAWRAGLVVASLPLPGRGMVVADYAALVRACCEAAGAREILVERDLAEGFSGAGLPVVAFDAVLECGQGGRRSESGGGLVQFTSGSTSRPKGIRLSPSAIVANVDQIIAGASLARGAVCCSWLPLSHDMGLVGCLLTPLVGASPDRCGAFDTVLLRPEEFVADPGGWLRAATESRATASAMPNLGLELAARHLARTTERFDLSALRTLIVGAERVRPATLRRFAAAAERHGLHPTALTPAYGLAEATLAVAMKPYGTTWRGASVDGASLGDGTWCPSDDGDAQEVTSVGPPLPGSHVRIESPEDRSVGELWIRTPSLLSGYAGAPSPLRDGWLPTADLGTFERGELFVVGRADDRICVGGRNLFAPELESAVESHPLVRTGACVAVPDEGGRYRILAEPRSEASREALRSGAIEIRAALAARFRSAPSGVAFVRRGELPKTPSGKLQRRRALALYASGDLTVVHEHAVGGGRAAGADGRA
jgi:acyl-CoA synthetase (AMP-forming)/AMP-acid ligase II